MEVQQPRSALRKKQQTGQQLRMNILTFHPPDTEVTFDFYYGDNPDRPMAPLHKSEWPEEVTPRTEDPFIYTDFLTTGKASLELTIDLEKVPRFAGGYLGYRLFKILGELADIRERNFIHNNVLWLRDEKYDHQGWKAYRQFELRVSIGKYTGRDDGQPALGELLINVRGHRYVGKDSMLDYHGDPSDINWVVYKGQNGRYEDLSEDTDLDHEEVYPVLNRQIAAHLGISMPHRYVSNKMKDYYGQLERIRKRLTAHEDFNQLFDLTEEGWYRPQQHRIHRLEAASRKLVFRGDRKAIEPKTGIWKHGGYRAPDQPCGIFFIMAEEDAREGGDGRALKKALIEGTEDFKSLSRYINTPIKYYGEDVLFRDIHNPLPDIMQRLTNGTFPDDRQLLAIYVNPIPEEKQGPRDQRPYYRLKEELLKRGIGMQNIHSHNIRDKYFKFHMRNIAPAVLAKLGGVPWKLDVPERDELIVGVGAFRPRDKDRQYVGSAFCFDNSGRFKGVQCFEKEQTNMLAGSIRDAVHRYVDKHGKPERLVIHYYKQMSRRERRPIERTLDNLGLDDVDIVIVTINKTPSFDTVVFDAGWQEKMPYSGTYLRLDHHRLLLCNNTRYPGRNGKPRDYPFPVKVYIKSDIRGFMHKEEEVERVVRQIYQFSRIYWKSADQQSLPVTIKYPEMVAQMLPYFKVDTLPPYARRSLWFL
ncbi:Piwi domain-containing protein [Fodinibius salsisoli]|uniref:Protein argonaute n=1 Tax=Fodinibius salsisoli TaxID=2820877 RepID=A0ABT3PTF2_9BACT|nr:Piwi domain-containing protein [Fodinibius salsisoli]MCW9709144.1 hypothetical protein [Fodinibius salsisoli]